MLYNPEMPFLLKVSSMMVAVKINQMTKGFQTPKIFKHSLFVDGFAMVVTRNGQGHGITSLHLDITRDWLQSGLSFSTLPCVHMLYNMSQGSYFLVSSVCVGLCFAFANRLLQKEQCVNASLDLKKTPTHPLLCLPSPVPPTHLSWTSAFVEDLENLVDRV